MTKTTEPIKTEADYDAALVQIEALMGAEADTLAGDRLAALAAAIAVYERQVWPIEAPDPKSAGA